MFSLMLLIPAIGFYNEGLETFSYISFTFIAIIIAIFSGIEFNLENKKYRKYISVFGLKNGKWLSYNEYIGIVIFSSKGTKRSLGLNYITHSRSKEIHNVFLVNKNHRKKIKIASKKSRKSVERFASDISEYLSIPIVKYSPKLSEKSLVRRKKNS
jgi:hypothetical protein